MITLTVTYADHQMMFYPVDHGGWRVDAAGRMLVIGTGVPRKMIPLDSVLVIEITEGGVMVPCQDCRQRVVETRSALQEVKTDG